MFLFLGIENNCKLGRVFFTFGSITMSYKKLGNSGSTSECFFRACMHHSINKTVTDNIIIKMK
ncbi:unnamed protein product [Amoebophrya sp. A25]|nr:unnamed protein product [Amoebophrya sp. A25]|eukprot:GSA25T00012467001.1